MDLKSYGNEDINKFAQRIENEQFNSDEKDVLEDLKDQYGNQVEDLISKFQGMNETELLGEIFKIINKQKKEGTFDPEKLRSIAQKIKPILNSEQQSKLDDLLQIISL